MKPIAKLIALFLVAIAAFLPRFAFAQAPAGPLPPRPGVPLQPAPPAEAASPIRVKVNLVSTPVTVRDSAGNLVLDLDAHNFRIYYNGTEQKIEHFDLGGDPLSVVFVVETSSRIEPLLPAVRKTGILFTQIVLGQTGEAAVLAFDDITAVLRPFTKDADAIEKTIAALPLGTSGARLYDALSHAVGLLRNRPTPEASARRRVIVLVSEATDTGSENKLGAVLREAQLNNITIYTIGLSTTAAMLRAEPSQAAPPSAFPPGTFPTPGIPGRPQTPTTEQQARGNIDLLAAIIWLVRTAANATGENALELVSAGTGGFHAATFRDRSIEKAMDQIGAELHAQYTLAYRPAGTPPAGYHEIKVVVARPGTTVRARPGYYLGETADERR
jgi:VWFA-related protein